jgi:hypothetical protein
MGCNGDMAHLKVDEFSELRTIFAETADYVDCFDTKCLRSAESSTVVDIKAVLVLAVYP